MKRWVGAFMLSLLLSASFGPTEVNAGSISGDGAQSLAPPVSVESDPVQGATQGILSSQPAPADQMVIPPVPILPPGEAEVKGGTEVAPLPGKVEPSNRTGSIAMTILFGLGCAAVIYAVITRLGRMKRRRNDGRQSQVG